MQDNLDLDALLPPKRTITIQGKQIEVKPLTVKGLLRVSTLMTKLEKAQTEEEVEGLLDEAFSPVVPGYKEFDLTPKQIAYMVKFLLDDAVPESAGPAKQFDPKKKEDLAKESPTSSDSIQDTQSKPSSENTPPDTT